MSDTAPYPLTITRDAFVDSYACAEGIAAFDDVAPDGVLTIADVTAHVALLSGPLARFEGCAVRKDVLPPIHATAGSYSYARAGYWGVATAGAFSHAVAGHHGRATAGLGGRATAGERGTAMAGARGRIEIDWYAGQRDRTAVGYIGETLDRDDAVLEAGVAYKVDSKGQFYRA